MPTRRERKIARLSEEIRELQRTRAAGRPAACNGNEELFRTRAKEKRLRVHRSGWPDFLVEAEGGTYAVEVKAANDVVRLNQAIMFDALERSGIPVYVWEPKSPGRLTPWRKSWRSAAALKGFDFALAHRALLEGAEVASV